MIQEEVKELLQILKESFVYEFEEKSHNHPSINIQSIPSIQIFPTTIHSSKEKKEQKQEITRRQVILAGAALAGILASSTYVMSQDEYVKFYLSKIDAKFELLKQLTNNQMPANILQLYDGWKSLYKNRTSIKCQAKVLGSASMMTSVGGYLFLNNLVLFGGIAGGTLCGCYLLWKYLSDQNTMLRKEQTYYDQLRNSLEIYYQSLQPKAPPFENSPPSYYS